MDTIILGSGRHVGDIIVVDGVFSGRRERFIGRSARATHGIVAAVADMLARRITTDPFAGLVIA